MDFLKNQSGYSGTSNDIPKQSPVTRNILSHKNVARRRIPNVSEFSIPEKYTHLILHDSGRGSPDRVLAIGDSNLLQELVKDTIYGDGTFDEVPNMYFQLYTWHAKVGNCYPPCVYFLLQNKNLPTYKKMFQILKDLLPNLAPQKICTDFDKDCMNAAQFSFPDVIIKGYYFDLCQKLVEKIEAVELKTDCESDTEVELKLKSLAALAFVPKDKVMSVFNELEPTFPHESSYNEILSYFYYTFIEGILGRNPQFLMTIWNHHDAVADESSANVITNCCEEYHNALNAIFRCTDSSIWFLLEELERDLSCHKYTLKKAHTEQREVKKKQYEILQEQISQIVRGYEAEENKLKYLKRLAKLQ